MITIQAKKHDNYSVEFKFGFEDGGKAEKKDFAVNTWIFIPNSIGINPENYGKNQFYRDIKSNIRLITPSFSISELADENALPLSSLRRAFENLVSAADSSAEDHYEYHLKMFSAIFKSAIRDFERHMRTSRAMDDADDLLESYLSDIRKAMDNFRSLYRIIDVPKVPEKLRGHFFLCDEFISHIVEMRTIRIIRRIDSARQSRMLTEWRERLITLIRQEREYKLRRGYGVVKDGEDKNRMVVYHHGMLKKFVESELYIRLDKKRDGVAVEQLYYSIAAGVAMIFATAVAWHTQVKYGNITWPLFLVLVVSYMLKDRIKDLLRYYFAHKLGNKYFDKKAIVEIGKKRIGVIKEGVDFISVSKIPERVMEMRNMSATIDDATRIFEEKIILYRKRVGIDGKALAENDDYPMKGINEIMRLHMTRFTQKMDNPEIPVDTIGENDEVSVVKVQKIYYINIIFQLQEHSGSTSYHHFRVAMTRNGIIRVEEI